MIQGGDISFSFDANRGTLVQFLFKSYSDLDNILVYLGGFSFGNNDLVMFQNEIKGNHEAKGN